MVLIGVLKGIGFRLRSLELQRNWTSHARKIHQLKKTDKLKSFVNETYLHNASEFSRSCICRRVSDIHLVETTKLHFRLLRLFLSRVRALQLHREELHLEQNHLIQLNHIHLRSSTEFGIFKALGTFVLEWWY